MARVLCMRRRRVRPAAVWMACARPRCGAAVLSCYGHARAQATFICEQSAFVATVAIHAAAVDPRRSRRREDPSRPSLQLHFATQRSDSCSRTCSFCRQVKWQAAKRPTRHRCPRHVRRAAAGHVDRSRPATPSPARRASHRQRRRRDPPVSRPLTFTQA